MRARLALLALLATLAAGCGFHLQGAATLPERLRVGYLDAPDRYSDLHDALAEAWTASGGRLVPTAGEAAAVLRVRRDESGERVLSISASNTPREYEVYYTVEYSVSVSGKEVLPPQVLTLTRSYSYDETAVLAKEHEERQIREAMARELAALMMRRLAAL